MRKPGRRSAALLITVLSAAVVTTGCLESDVEVKVDKDGSGEVAVEVFLTNAVEQALDGVDVETQISGAFQGVDGFEFEQIDRDGREGYRLYVPFDDYLELSQVLTAGGTVAGQQVSLFSSFQLTELSEGGWELDATINPLGQIISGARDGQIPLTAEELLDAAGVGAAGTGLDLTVSLPGEVVSSNADEVDGGSATWNLDAPDAPVQLQMRTDPKPLLSPLLMVVLGSLAVVLLGVVLVLFGAGRTYHRTEGDRTRRRRDKARRKGKVDPTSAWAPKPTDALPTVSDRSDPLPGLSEVPALPPIAPDGPPLPGATPTAAPAPSTTTMIEAPDDTSVSSQVDAAAPTASPVASWYPDPDGGAGYRWWDGASWTEHRSG